MLKRIENKKPFSRKSMRTKRIIYGNIIKIMKDIAPKGCYFGTHPQDSTLIGYWDKS
jgi:hypothetical protein